MFIDFRDRGREGERERESEGEREREREKHQCERSVDWLPPICALTMDQTHNLGMCPDRESNLQPFGVRDNLLNYSTRALILVS